MIILFINGQAILFQVMYEGVKVELQAEKQTDYSPFTLNRQLAS